MDVSKIAFVSQNVQSFKKIHRRKRKKIHSLFSCERVQIAEACIISARGHKTIGSHLKNTQLTTTHCSVMRAVSTIAREV